MANVTLAAAVDTPSSSTFASTLLDGASLYGNAMLNSGYYKESLLGNYSEGLVIVTPTYPNVKYVYKDVDRGDGTKGTLNASNISEAAGAGSDLTPDILKKDEVVDDVTGTYEGAGDSPTVFGFSN